MILARLVGISLPLFLTVAVGQSADETKPALVSTTGAGKTWSDLAELKKAVDAENPAALEAYGEMVLNGDEVPKDVPAAIALFERAAKAGDASAAFRLGKIYEDGEVFPRDAAKALTNYKMAASKGVAAAQYNLGAMYVSARDGVPRDYQEGLAWLIVATKNGAEGEGEQKVRARLTATHRGDVIPAAEKRALEIAQDLASPKQSIPSPSPAQNGQP